MTTTPKLQPTRALALLVTGGQLPPKSEIVIATQRLRGAIVAAAVGQLRPGEQARYDDLSADEAEMLAPLAGKHGDGHLAAGNRHLVLWPLYGQRGAPDRLLLFKADGFAAFERAAVFAAAQRPVRWGRGEGEAFRVLPLPLGDDGAELFDSARSWVSLTPFVPPQGRHRFDARGRPRAKELPERQVARLCAQMGHGTPARVEVLDHVGAMRVHWSWTTRQAAHNGPRPATHWPGYWVHISFEAPVQGPIFLGNSNHFGLGLFRPEFGEGGAGVPTRNDGGADALQ
ncbi:MAG: type I-U CRISPR-associated protein Cas5/Cas6 [Deltaproteobacteria bacterium]|nr:type I-U CRISPR-associated protein Cas5/Cas6 [Deltaproteobacteria bacterium]